MIINEIDQLVKFLQIKTATNCSFGDIDLGADDLPHIKVIPVSNISVLRLSENDNSVNFPVELRIISQRKEERQAIAILERLLTSLPDYHDSQGHFIAEAGTTLYTPNTYEIIINYNLKVITGD